MEPKLTILFVVIGCIIALSHLGDDAPGRLRRRFSMRQWRNWMPGLRRL